MTVSSVSNNLTASRFDIYVDGLVAASAHYRMEAGHMSFIYTEVNRRLEIPNVVPQLLRGCLEDAHRRRLAVLPYCPVVWEYLRHHAEFVELIPLSERRRFRLVRGGETPTPIPRNGGGYSRSAL